jgi:hypothetical protein
MPSSWENDEEEEGRAHHRRRDAGKGGASMPTSWVHGEEGSLTRRRHMDEGKGGSRKRPRTLRDEMPGEGWPTPPRAVRGDSQAWQGYDDGRDSQDDWSHGGNYHGDWRPWSHDEERRQDDWNDSEFWDAKTDAAAMQAENDALRQKVAQFEDVVPPGPNDRMEFATLMSKMLEQSQSAAQQGRADSRKMAKLLSQRRRPNDALDSDESGAEECDMRVPELLRAYRLHELEAANLPPMKTIRRAMEMAKREKDAGRKPVVSLPLNGAMIPVGAKMSPWATEFAKSKDCLEAMTQAQFTMLWWARAHLQLLVQAALKEEVISLGLLMKRSHQLLMITIDESVRHAKYYDERTWSTFVAACQIHDTRASADCLGEIQENVLANVRTKLMAKGSHSAGKGAGKYTPKGGHTGKGQKGDSWTKGGKAYSGKGGRFHDGKKGGHHHYDGGKGGYPQGKHAGKGEAQQDSQSGKGSNQ